MIINYTTESVLETYEKYFTSLNVLYKLDENKKQIIIENATELESFLPITYEKTNLFIEQILYFTQLLNEHNLTISYFSPIYFNMVLSSNIVKQKGGDNTNTIQRIEDKLLDNTHHAADINDLEENIPIIFLTTPELILETNNENSNFLILYKDSQKIKHLIENGDKFYSFYSEYKNTLLDKLLKKKYEDIFFKESYESLYLFIVSLLLGTKQKINSKKELISLLKKTINKTPIFFLLDRINNKDSYKRFLFLL